MYSRAGRVKIATLLTPSGLSLRNDSDHFIVWGGFIIGAHESMSIAPWQNTSHNPGHWKARQEELHLVADVHARREAIDSRDVQSGGATGRG